MIMTYKLTFSNYKHKRLNERNVETRKLINVISSLELDF